MENKELRISEEYLTELLDYIGRATVGKVCKRFEVIENRDILKVEIKELIYEEMRNLKNLILAYDKGLSIQQFVMKSPKEKNSSK